MFQKNEAQEKAIKLTNGHVMIVACPGSGKTTTMIRRIRHMIELGVDPSRIMMVTFSKAAALEMGQKYARFFGRNDGVHFSTIHSFCYQFLTQHNIYRPENHISESDEMNLFLPIIYKVEKQKPWEMANAVKTGISVVRNNQLDYMTYKCEGVTDEVFQHLYRTYMDYKELHHLYDYDDMLVDTLTALQHDPLLLKEVQDQYDYIMCDEYQDTNFTQRDILYLISGKCGNLCVVGDDDQSIYQFRGARPEIMLGFQNDFPDTIRIDMGTNYRSGKSVVDHADQLIKHNKKRFQKEFISFRGTEGIDGEVLSYRGVDYNQELNWVTEHIQQLQSEKQLPYSDMAMLFRTKDSMDLAIQALSKAQIPFYTTESIQTIYETSFFEDIKHYTHLAVGEGTKHDFLSVLNHPNRYMRVRNYEQCDYTISSILDCARRVLAKEPAWRYDRLSDAIIDWISAFGANAFSYDDTPQMIFRGLRRIQYEKYIKDYAETRNESPDTYLATLKTLEEESKRFRTIREWFAYAENYILRFKKEMQKKTKDGVTLTTIHKSKGLEWSAVFVCRMNDGNMPHKKSSSTGDAEEERRLCYVAMTRAKDYLFLSGSGSAISPYMRDAGLISNKNRIVIKDTGNSSSPAKSSIRKKQDAATSKRIVKKKFLTRSEVLEKRERNTI